MSVEPSDTRTSPPADQAIRNGESSFVREVYWDFRAGRGFNGTALRAHLLRSIIHLGGIRVRIDPGLSYTVVKALVAAEYEAPERTLLESALQPDDVVMELGAGLGYISTVCARLTDSSRVFAYEANPMMEPMIRDTFRLNRVSPELNMCMVGEAVGTATLHVTRDFWAASTIRRKNRSRPVTVNVVSLRDELMRIKPTVVIADIEGGEYDLFRAFPPHACRLIMLELHPDVLGEERAAETLRAIEAAGFQIAAQLRRAFLFRRA